jgi:hypothetical protein
VTLEEFFGRPDTPEAGSPVGAAMGALLKARPDLSLDDARWIVNDPAYRGPKSLVHLKAA